MTNIDIFNIGGSIASILGLGLFGFVRYIWQQLPIVKNMKVFRNIVESMKSKLPIKKESASTSTTIKIKDISVYDISHMKNRYTVEDIREYITRLEAIETTLILNMYGIPSMVGALQKMLDTLNNTTNSFDINFASLKIVKMLNDNHIYESVFHKKYKIMKNVLVKNFIMFAVKRLHISIRYIHRFLNT